MVRIEAARQEELCLFEHMTLQSRLFERFTFVEGQLCKALSKLLYFMF